MNDTLDIILNHYHEKPAAAKKPFHYDPDEDDGEVDGGVDTILAASEKVLAVNRGLTDPDERDSLRFRKIHSMDRLLGERIALDANKTLRSTMRRISRQGSLKSLVPGHFSDYAEGLVVGNPLSLPLEEINPIHLLEQARRVTQMGPGGLPSSSSITEEAQNLHPSEFFFLSSIEGPECFAAGHEVMTDAGWVAWMNVTPDTKFLCRRQGEEFYAKAKHLVKEHYHGQLFTAKGDDYCFRVTPSHRIYYYADEGTIQWKYARNVYGLELKIPTRESPPLKVREADWDLTIYKGKVYCATVPGGMMYTRSGGFGRGYWTGNSERIGVDTRVAWGAKLGSDGRIYQRFKNKRTGKYEWLSAQDLEDKIVGIPD